MNHHTLSLFLRLSFIGLIAVMVGKPGAINAAEETRTITLATVEWEPYFGPNLPEEGFYTEISRAAFKEAGYHLKIVYLPWVRRRISRLGIYDGLLGAAYTEERTPFLSYTEQCIHTIVYSFVEQTAQSFSLPLMNCLHPELVPCVSVYQDEIKTKDHLTLEEVSTEDLNIKKLMKNRIDLFVSDRLFILNLIKTKFPEYEGKIQAINPVLKYDQLHNPISKKTASYEKITRDFNYGLRIIKENGTFDKILKKHGFDRPGQ